MTVRLGVSYDDMQGPVQAGAGVGALTTEGYRDTPFQMSFFRHDQDDNLSFIFQFSHRKQLGSMIASVHLHCVPMVNPAVPQTCYFQYYFSWQTTGGTFPALVGWTAANPTMTVGVADAFILKYSSFVTSIAAPANEGYSSILLFYIARLGTSPNDTYNTNKAVPPGTAAANLGLLGIDVHFAVDRSGSLQEGSD